MIYLGVDPGDTTGVFRIDTAHPRHRVALQLPDPVTVHDWVRSTIEEGPTEVAIERFDISNRTLRTKRTTAVLDVIGSLRVLCAATGTRCEMQSVAEAKGCTNDQLRAAGWYTVGLPHANDAARHVYLLALKRCPGILLDSFE